MNRRKDEESPLRLESQVERINVMKAKLSKILVLAAIAVAAAIGIAAQEMRRADSTGLPEALWKRGLAIAPVPLNLAGRDRKLVGYGSYIVNAQGICSDCHTNPSFRAGGDPYQGQPEQTNTDHYLAGGKKFKNGTITSRNITPDLKSGLPADLTFDQFVHVIRTGEDPDNLHPEISPLLQAMTWPFFKKMTDHDLQSIYEYLSSIPHAEPGP